MHYNQKTNFPQEQLSTVFGLTKTFFVVFAKSKNSKGLPGVSVFVVSALGGKDKEPCLYFSGLSAFFVFILWDAVLTIII